MMNKSEEQETYIIAYELFNRIDDNEIVRAVMFLRALSGKNFGGLDMKKVELVDWVLRHDYLAELAELLGYDWQMMLDSFREKYGASNE